MVSRRGVLDSVVDTFKDTCSSYITGNILCMFIACACLKFLSTLQPLYNTFAC